MQLLFVQNFWTSCFQMAARMGTLAKLEHRHFLATLSYPVLWKWRRWWNFLSLLLVSCSPSSGPGNTSAHAQVSLCMLSHWFLMEIFMLNTYRSVPGSHPNTLNGWSSYLSNSNYTNICVLKMCFIKGLE